jgi:hypothetical protein
MKTPALDAAFNIPGDRHRYRFEKTSPVTLSVRIWTPMSAVCNTYDFVGRVMIAQTGSTGSSPQIVPFAQLDCESLVFMHAQLTELGGSPPALPADAESTTRPALAKPRITP